MTLTPPFNASVTQQPRTREGETPVLRCSNTADFLAALPFLTGFTAENSLFIVLFEGKRSGSAIRIDLPPGDTPQETTPVLEVVCKLLEATGAGPQGPALVITSERSFADAGGVPWRRFAKRLERRLAREGWWIREFACVASDGWAQYANADSPRARRPLAEINASLVAQAAEELGRSHVTLAEVGALPDVDEAQARRVREEIERLTARELQGSRTGSAGDAARASAPDPLRQLQAVADTAGELFWCRSLPADAALCARFLRDAECADRWLVQALTAVTRPEFVAELLVESGAERFTDVAVDEAQRASRGVRDGWSIAGLLVTLGQEAPEREKLRAAIDALAWCAAHAPREYQPGALSLLAWAWWMLGMQSVAERMVDAALAINPDHALSRMALDLNRSVPAWHLTAHRPV